jgi:hypothetical protein
MSLAVSKYVSTTEAYSSELKRGMENNSLVGKRSRFDTLNQKSVRRRVVTA